MGRHHNRITCTCSLILLLFVLVSLSSISPADGSNRHSKSQTKVKGSKSGDRGESTAETDEKTEEEKAMEEWLRKMLPREVVVVGAGISGLAVARRITRNKSNFTVKVFEAQKERYGGRVWTDKLTDMKARGPEVDLGASALNTVAKNNPLIGLAEDFELKMASIDNLQFIIPWENKAFSGEQLSEVTKDAGLILSTALNESISWKEEVSVTFAVDKVLERGDIAATKSPGAELVKCLPSYILGDYSTWNYEADLLDIGYEKVLLDGMGELLDRLVSGSPDEPPLHLHLNKAVRQIKVDDSKQKVIVRTTDGLQTEADIVVMAVPAAVIASSDIIFDPPLPRHYQLAFSELSPIAANKVIVEFEHAFWPPDFGVFVRAVQSPKERGHLQTWVNIHRILSKPVLSSFLTGQPAVKFEKLSDGEVKDAVLESLTDMFGSDKVASGGKIVKLQRSKWIGSKFSRGSTTYPKVGTNPKLWDTLSEPLCPYVYFVGEHSGSEARGTLHGAYNSGIKAGDQILSFYCDQKAEEERQRKEEEMKRKKEEKTKGEKKEEDTQKSDEHEEL